jgi:hypothetical protein
MAERDDRRLFADGIIAICGEWVTGMEWIAHKSLDLPADWMDCAIEVDKYASGIANYLFAALKSEPVEFGETREIIEDGFSWNYTDVIGAPETTVNEDIREFFEALTPGAEWRLSWTSMRARNARPVDGPLLSRVMPGGEVLFMVAGCNPAVANVARAGR